MQKQILDLLDELRTAFDLSMLFIAHDLRDAAARMCERIAFMKGGMIVEQGATADIFTQPRRENAKTLLASVPGRERQQKANLPK